MTRRMALVSGLVLSTTVLTTTLAAGAFAQPVSATTPSVTTTLDNIVVTATRTEQSVRETLGSVDVLNTADIERAQPRSAAEAVKALPNVQLENGPRQAITQMNIRGLDDRRIGIKVDGVSRNFRGEYKGRTYFNPSILKRVEVARGGNSVLDGSGAIAGTVQYITKDAADYLDDGDNRGMTVGMTGASNGGMIGGNVAVYGRNNTLDALVFHETTTGGNITLGNGEELAFSELTTRQNMAKGSYKINDDAKVTATVTDYFDVGDSLSNPIRTGAAAGFSTNRRASSQVGDLKAEYAPVDNEMVNVTVLASVANTKVTEVVTQAGASFGRRDRTEFEEQSLEVYNTSHLANHAVTYGGEIAKDKQTGQRPGAGRTQLYPNAKSTNAALYVQDEMDFGRLTVTPGVRWESYELKGAANATRNEGDQVVGKLAAGYKLTPATQTYASVSQGYRAPLLSEAYSGGSLGGPLTLVANPNLKPEESTNFEVGVKSEQKPNWTKNDGMTLTGSVFYNDLKNLIERQSVTPPFIFGYRNVEDAYTYGAEAGVGYTTPNWFANLNVGATRGENKTQDRALLGIPPLKANLQVGRQGVTTDGSTWRVAYTLEAASSQNRVPANDLLVQPSDKYAVHGVQAEYEPTWTILGAKKTSLKVSVDNLFDTAYRPVTSFLYQPGLDVRTAISLKF